MNIIWLGHGSFRIEIGDQVLLIDPWLSGNPMLPEDQHGPATQGATHILVTHGHSDHTDGVAELSKAKGIPLSATYELGRYLHGKGAVEGHAFHRGGTITLGTASATLVPASHSSSVPTEAGDVYTGVPCGYIIRGEGKVIYFSGDTDIMADMQWMGDFYKPDIGILSAGGYFTMDMEGAAFAARHFFHFGTVIPCHYRTFPLLEQNASALRRGLPGVDVIEPQIMQPIPL
ncbi:metal-dependent hydrolase [uncultured Tateyamaria sp.]|uniref:metal-dependent hydrolase n=1 Tax=Tateyamaria sp. 1078 TaxID=3417464 RepID=UPI00262410D2|nr:metal-dependent hydrolase [uncultured Tateyamaria sp.]